MPPKRGRFDAAGFCQALDATRQAKQITWKQVAGESGVSASTLTRMAQGKRPDVDSLAKLCAWSGLSADQFVRTGERPDAEPLAMISTYLRSDPNLDDNGAAFLEDVIRAAYERLRLAR